MKSKDEIKTHLEGWVTYPEHASKVAEMCLEVLLDIREMLISLAHPLITVEEVEMSFDELTQKYKDEGERPSLGFTGVFRTPTGDIVTTADTSPTGKYCDECGSYDHTTKEH